MAFLNPILLLGILGVSVPIVIHLLNKRRVERVWWGAMRFIRAAVERNERRLRLEDLLLLVLRCLVVALLALTLARPALTGGGGGLGRARVSAVVMVDVSASMGATDGVRSRMELAREAVTELVAGLPPGSRVAVWAVSDTVRPLIPEPTGDLNLVRRTIDELRPSDRSTRLAPAVSRGAAALKAWQAAGGDARELYLISDGQRGGFDALDALTRALDDARPEVRGTIVFVGADAGTENLGVSVLRQATGVAATGRPVRFTASIANHGGTDAADVRVVLRSVAVGASGDGGSGGGVGSGGGAPLDEAVIDRLPPGETRAVSLFARAPAAGNWVVRAEIPADRLRADDERAVVSRVVEQVKVLLVDGDPGTEARQSQAFYLRQALSPSGEEGSWFVRTELVQAAELGGVRLDDFDAVVLAGVGDVSPAAADALLQYVRRGGGLLSFSPPTARAELLNRELFDRRALLPARLGDARGDTAAEKPALSLSTRDLEHPVASLWKDPAAGDLGGVGFFRVFPLTPAADARVVLRFSDNSPAVVERRVGTGRVLQFAFPATTQWGDLPLRPGVFVPLMYRSLGAVLAGQEERLNVAVGEAFAYRAPAEWIGRDVAVFTPAHVPGRPPDDARRVELADGEARIMFDATDLAGPYLLRAEGEGGGRVVFAAQRDPAESDLAPVGAVEREALARSATVIDYSPGGGSLAAVTRARSGVEVWWPLAIAVLLLAAVESGAAWWFSRPR